MFVDLNFYIDNSITFSYFKNKLKQTGLQDHIKKKKKFKLFLKLNKSSKQCV